MSNDSLMDGRNLLDLIRNALSLSDGSLSLFELAYYLKLPLSDVWTVFHLLCDQKLLKPVTP